MDCSIFSGRDPEYADIVSGFLDEVENEEGQTIGSEERGIAVLSALIGCQGVSAFEAVLRSELRGGLSPVVVRETVYQSTAYVGIGRAMPFVEVMDRVMSEEGIPLPLPSGRTVSRDERVSAGEAVQVSAFGEMMGGAWRTGHVNRWLAGNCFGDYYTREGLTLAQRELVTFCLLMAQGGCEPQLEAHTRGNMNVGNDADFLRRVVSQCLPYIGYPRSLNALAAIARVESADNKG